MKYVDPDGRVCLSYFDNELNKYNIYALDKRDTKITNILSSILDFYPFGIGEVGKILAAWIGTVDSRLIGSSLAKEHYLSSNYADCIGFVADSLSLFSRYKTELQKISNVLGNLSTYIINPALLGLSIGEQNSWIVDNIVVNLCNKSLASCSRKGVEKKYIIARDKIKSMIEEGSILVLYSEQEKQYYYDVINDNEFTNRCKLLTFLLYKKQKKIIFVGTDNPLLKYLSKENETEVVSSISYLPMLAMRFVPELIIFNGIKTCDVLAIRKTQNLEKALILITEENFRDFANINTISDFKNVILCNTSIAKTQDFLSHLNEFLEKKINPLPSKTSRIVKYSILYMNKNFQKKLTRTQIAAHMGVANDYLTRIFFSEMGISLWTYLTMIRIEEAKNLLIYSAKSISDISELCGFSQVSYFNNVFKKSTGTTPGMFRK